jgi:hypothetical protein
MPRANEAKRGLTAAHSPSSLLVLEARTIEN